MKAGFQFRPHQDASEQSVLRNHSVLLQTRSSKSTTIEVHTVAFEVHTDAMGAKSVSKVRDELTKNHREEYEAEEGGVIYATEGVWCPAASYEKYVQHLNLKNEFLFQRPKKEVSSDVVVWYDNMVVGERSLCDMMKRRTQTCHVFIQTIPSELQPSLFLINQNLKLVAW